MKSALSIIALSKSDRTQAIVALLEVALEVLDATEHSLPAAYIDLGLNTFLEQIASSPVDELKRLKKLN